jgi:hypothetical protein
MTQERIMYGTITDQLIRTAGDTARVAGTIEKAIKTIQKIPGWKKLIREIWPDVVKGLMGGKKLTDKTAGPKDLLIKAIVMLLISMNVDAQEASNPGMIEKVIETVEQKGQTGYTQLEIDKMADLIPFLVNKTEQNLLKAGLSPLFAFKGIFSKKVQRGLDQIKKQILSNPVMAALKKEQLADLVAKGLMKKIEDPQYADIKEDLISYLEKKDQSLSLLETIAYKTTLDFLKKNKDFKI